MRLSLWTWNNKIYLLKSIVLFVLLLGRLGRILFYLCYQGDWAKHCFICVIREIGLSIVLFVLLWRSVYCFICVVIWEIGLSTVLFVLLSRRLSQVLFYWCLLERLGWICLYFKRQTEQSIKGLFLVFLIRLGLVLFIIWVFIFAVWLAVTVILFMFVFQGNWTWICCRLRAEKFSLPPFDFFTCVKLFSCDQCTP